MKVSRKKNRKQTTRDLNSQNKDNFKNKHIK